jgi:hypothetical protein
MDVILGPHQNRLNLLQTDTAGTLHHTSSSGHPLFAVKFITRLQNDIN